MKKQELIKAIVSTGKSELTEKMLQDCTVATLKSIVTEYTSQATQEPTQEPETVSLETEVIAVIEAENGVTNAYSTLKEKALILLDKAGLIHAVDKAHNEAVLQACKQAVNKQLSIVCEFKTRDTEGQAGIQAKIYKSISNALAQVSAQYRNDDGKGVPNVRRAGGNGTRTNKPAQDNQEQAQDNQEPAQDNQEPAQAPALNAGSLETVKVILKQDTQDNLNAIYSIEGKTIKEIWEQLEDEFLALIASNPTIQKDIAYALTCKTL